MFTRLLNRAKAIFEAKVNISESASTIAGHFPPSSKMQGVKCLAAASGSMQVYLLSGSL
jgi:hypothetical protein